MEINVEVELRISESHFMYADARAEVVKVLNPFIREVRILDGRCAGWSGLAFNPDNDALELPFVPYESLIR